jgi:hypothetical protein
MSDGTALSATRRWQLVNDRLRAEARTATYEKKLAQLASLMASVDDFGWRQKLAEDDDRVRELWNKLRSAWSRG